MQAYMHAIIIVNQPPASLHTKFAGHHAELYTFGTTDAANIVALIAALTEGRGWETASDGRWGASKIHLLLVVARRKKALVSQSFILLLSRNMLQQEAQSTD